MFMIFCGNLIINEKINNYQNVYTLNIANYNRCIYIKYYKILFFNYL